ncbi:unnamed protein product [Cuscuta europaea]|uniref:Reverse transcriptase zinc-binding domain-containing protein n=1 Tax=Cuscuta europaea TaxID=41803 RepID=A0A9P0ZGD8_CUSEU|nr:unnamed protein product [Cuscuta europaea]
MNAFWWRGHGFKGKGIRWLNWSDLCVPKSLVGMWFRKFRDFNIAMLGKHVWRLLKQPESLVSKILKARNFPKDDMLEASLGNNPSLIWRSIVAAIPTVREGVLHRVGDGSSIRVCKDKWILKAIGGDRPENLLAD